MIHALNYRDKVVIPDKYNTGCKGLLTPIEKLYPNWTGYIDPTFVQKMGTTFNNILFTTTVTVKIL